MLVLSRKPGESIVVGGRIVVTVARVDGDSVRIGIQAPQDVAVHRKEVYDEILRNNQEAASRGRRTVPKLPPRTPRPQTPPSEAGPNPAAKT